ncbi:putative PEP-binding protein [Rhodococcus aetherivorans]
MATAAEGRPILLRLPDVRSDDAILASMFFDHREPNPALGEHGTRYWLRHPELLDLVRKVINRLPPNVFVSAPFITSRCEFTEFYNKLGKMPLVPFVESPQFIHEHELYADVSQVCIGLKDLSYLLLAHDREFANSVPTLQILQNAVKILEKAVQYLSERDVKVTLYCPREAIPLFEEILGDHAWVPSIPAADAKLVAPRAGMKEDQS